MAYKHLTYEERILIADRLKHNISIKSIANELSRSTSTISREIKNHTIYKKPRGITCRNYSDCTAAKLCPGCTSKYRLKCKKCTACYRNCPDYEPYQCPTHSSPPYVCNGCYKIYSCPAERRIYNPKYAQDEYKRILTENRAGFDLTEEELERIDQLVTPLIKKGQSPYHILQTLGDDISISESTLRRIIDSTQISARNIDLRVQVKRKSRHRRMTASEQARISKAKIGHTWNDYLKFKEKHPDIPVIEMDCVEGLKTEPAVLLTLHFDLYHLQLAFILSEHTSTEVVKALDRMEEALSTDLFRQMCPLINTSASLYTISA